MNVWRQAYLEKISTRLADNPIVSLVGPRRVGKTTLARTFAEQITRPVHFFDLEAPFDLARLSNPELVLRPLEGLVIIDEVQRRPDLFPLLRVLADRPESPARILILGSASPTLMQQARESLAGRVSFIDVAGLSLAEMGADSLSQLWWRGGSRGLFSQTPTSLPGNGWMISDAPSLNATSRNLVFGYRRQRSVGFG